MNSLSGATEKQRCIFLAEDVMEKKKEIICVILRPGATWKCSASCETQGKHQKTSLTIFFHTVDDDLLQIIQLLAIKCLLSN